LVDLANAVTKVVPDITLKHEDMHKYGVDTAIHPNGVGYSFKVFHNTDLNNHIGKLTLESFNSKTPKFGIQSINIDDGRATWGEDGQCKTSIHAKNIVRVAKKVFKPFTFNQIAMRCSKKFKQSVESIQNNMRWELRQKVCDGYHHLVNDLEHLRSMGYTPQNARFKQMMEYVGENKAKIDKYMDYNPHHYFVLVQGNQVQYCLNSAKDFADPYTVANKDDLPEDIRGKLFVLDISDKQDFVEDVGLKENDGAYWIIA
jgi:hypothetical protein